MGKNIIFTDNYIKFTEKNNKSLLRFNCLPNLKALDI
jgi:hypothetical protein